MWLAIALGILTLLGIPIVAIAWARTPYATGEQQPVDQPIPFDHRHHYRDDGIDCLYCHAEATRSRYAGVPSTARCMGCHAQIWVDSPNLALVRASLAEGKPIPWQRVHRMPGFVYFDHHIHLAKGVGCVSCHGRVDLMAQVYAQAPLTMGWCLDCHRDPEVHLRPLDRITDMEWFPEGTPREIGRALRAELGVESRTDCTTYHR